MNPFNGLVLGLDGLSKLSKTKTRSISAENFTGEKGKGGMANRGYGSRLRTGFGTRLEGFTSISIPAQTTFTLAEIEGPGVIQHMWMTCFPCPLAQFDSEDLLGWRG